MKTLFTTLLVIHIAAGFISLIVGFIIAASGKGTALHRRLGRIFYYGMLVITLTAICMSLLHSNDFLLAIALFSLFQALGGRRVINNGGNRRTVWDFLLLFFGGAVSLWMLFSGNGLLLFFGVLNAAAAIGFARYCFSARFLGTEGYRNRLGVHINMMGGSFIATLTAFVVVNVPSSLYTYLPAWLPWIIPTLSFTPVMVYWARKYTPRRKLRAV